MTNFESVRKFMKTLGQEIKKKAQFPDDQITKLRFALIKEELGDRWLEPDLFRFGASSLLGDIERQLEHHVTGHYSASYRHAIG